MNNTPNGKDKYYNIITIAFILCLIASNFGAIKLCNFFGYTLPGGILIFPLLYILNDILTEVYGFSASRKAIWTALLCNCILSLYLYGVIFLPPSPYWTEQEAFETIFSLSPLIFFASVTSYFIGELMNATVLALLKIKLKGRMFAIRAIFSTFVGALLETAIFCTIAFSRQISNSQLLEMIILLTCVKVIYELLAMPLTLKIVASLKRQEGKDVFERPTLRGLLPIFFRN